MLLMIIGPTMAATNYVVPSGGIIQDNQEGFNPVIPSTGIYQAQAAAVSSAAQFIMIGE